MLLNQIVLIVFFSIVVRIIAVNSLNNHNNANFLDIRKTLNEILQLCCQDHLNPLIITEQSSKYIHHPKGELLSIILVNDSFNIEHKIKNSNPHRGMFLLTALSDDQFNITLSRLQSTPWWNTLSYFFLIGPSPHSCLDALKMLTTMWKRKILSAIYLCYDVDAKAVMLYTFNPFTNYAPHPWKWVKSFQDKPDPRWTLYEYQYQLGDQTICPAIMFDKTLRLDDYVLSILMDKKARRNSLPTGVPVKLYDYVKDAPLMGISVMTAVFTQMKVKVNITDCHGMWITKKGQLHGQLQRLLDKDMFMRIRPLYLGFEHITYPDTILNLVFIGQKRPFLNTETKILSFYHLDIIKLSIIVFFISAFVLKLNKQQEYLSAFLKMWQLYLGNYIPQVLKNTPTRIFFFGVFWLVMILNGAFQSKLASFLTKPERTYVNSLEDAFRLKYHIYGSKDFMTGAGYSEFPAERQKYIHYLKTYRCIDIVLNNSQALCLAAPNYGTIMAKKYGLYVSPPVHRFYTVNWVSPGFPLKSRIDRVILDLQASGFMVQVYRKTFSDRLDCIHAREEDETRFRNRPIELNDLLFIFKVLILGLVCSLIVFITEVRIN